MSAAVPRVTNLVRETNQLPQEAATDPSTGQDAGSAVQVANAWPVDASSIDEHGMTPLMRAAYEGSAGTVRALLNRGAELEAKRTDGLNALSLAAFFGHSQVVWILLEHGADLAATGRAGTLPEIWAEVRGFTEISDMIREARRQKQEAESRLRTAAIDEAVRFPRAADLIEPQVLANPIREAEGASSQVREGIEAVAEEPPERRVEAAAAIIETAPPVQTQETPAPPVETRETPAPPVKTLETAAQAVQTQERHEPVQTQERPAQPEQTQERPAPGEPTGALKFLPEIEDPPPLAVPQFNPGSAFISRIGSNRRILFALTVVMLMILGGIATLLIQQVRIMRAKQGTEAVTNTPNGTVGSSNPVNAPGTSAPAQQVETQSTSTTELTVVPSASGTEQAAADGKTIDSTAPGQTGDLSRGEPAKESYAERVDTRLATSVEPGVGSAIENKHESTPASPITQFRAPFRKQRSASKATQFKQSVVDEAPKPAPLTVEATTRTRSVISTPERSDTQGQASQPPPLSVTSGKPKSKVIQWP